MRFIEKIQYKCQLAGIKVILNEESYTSKASALDSDPIPVYDKENPQKYKFSGYRESRGVYKRKGLKGIGKRVNADVNGSLNIGRKVFGNGYEECYRANRGYVVYPIKVRPS